jgi:hypothetical protein
MDGAHPPTWAERIGVGMSVTTARPTAKGPWPSEKMGKMVAGATTGFSAFFGVQA